MPPTNNNPPPTISPGQEIDTGTGGFPVDGKVVTYDVGSDVGDTTPQQWSAGQIKVDDSPRDISNGTKRTLASYLSRTTMGQTPSSPSSIKNSYPVEHNPADNPQTIKLKDANGYPTAPGGNQNPKYVQETLLSSRSDAAVNLKILRGKQQPNDEQKVDGNNLLKDATPPVTNRPTNPSAVGGVLPKIQGTALDPASPINNYYGSPKLSNSVIFNRFNPEGSRYEDKGGFGSFQFSSKYEMGTSVANRDMSHARLAQIGNALSIRAGLELTSTQDDNNPTDNTTTAAAILPGAAQLGIMRIDRDTLTARDVLNSGIDEALDTDLLIDPAAKSWGTLNNVLDQYAGVSNFGMQLLAVALVVALGVATALFMKLFSFGGTSSFIAADDRQIRPYGASLYDPKRSSGGGVSEILKLIKGEISIWGMLGIRPTLSAFENCLASGALQFFGIDASAATATDLAKVVAVEGLVPASQNPGFYAVMARSFNRSFLLLSDYFVGLVKAFGAGVVAGLQQMFAIIDVLRSSKFIKFLDTFGQLGDKKINSIDELDEAKGPGKKFKSNIDFASNLAPGKGRINKSGTGLSALTQAKSAFKAPDLLIMPTNFLGLSNSNLGVPKFQSDVTKENSLENRISSLAAGQANFANKLLNGNYLSVSDGRISTEDREQMENILEAEYVPFYLHDIRTNEILSFHAFLASLSDDYSASYDSMEAFGRVEPIKTYKGTTRKISFSFMLAAYSKNDFDAMWNKINKLTTMVYPQFSEGRKLVSPDGKSIVYAPFSQSISAAPMIRVRIGDLIKSNYSKFGLARLFGMYYEDTKLDNYTRTGKSPELSYDEAKKKEIVKGNTFVIDANVKLGTDVFDETTLIPMQKQMYTTDPNLTLPKGYVLKLKKIIPAKEGANDVAICTVELAEGDDAITPIPDYIKDKTYEGGEGKSPSNNILGKAYKIDATQLQLSEETLKKVRKRIDASKPTGNVSYDDQVKELMNDDNVAGGNAVARSFRTVGGKGLPGFIESLAFDWYDKVTWTTDEGEGRKAPKMCKVTISFSPFHDITPGLDHKGFNRAPIYPVGPMSSKK